MTRGSQFHTNSGSISTCSRVCPRREAQLHSSVLKRRVERSPENKRPLGLSIGVKLPAASSFTGGEMVSPGEQNRPAEACQPQNHGKQ